MNTVLRLTELEWTALSAIATFLVSLIALFVPYLQKRKKYNNMKNLIKAEFVDHLKKIRTAYEAQDVSLNTDTSKKITIKKIDVQMALIDNVSFKHWYEFRYEIAIHRVKFYNKYKESLQLIENLVLYRKQTPFIQPLFQNTIEDIVKKADDLEV